MSDLIHVLVDKIESQLSITNTLVADLRKQLGETASGNQAGNPTEALTQIYGIFSELHYLNYHTNLSESMWEKALEEAHSKVKEVIESVTGLVPPVKDTNTNPSDKLSADQQTYQNRLGKLNQLEQEL